MEVRLTVFCIMLFCVIISCHDSGPVVIQTETHDTTVTVGNVRFTFTVLSFPSPYPSGKNMRVIGYGRVTNIGETDINGIYTEIALFWPYENFTNNRSVLDTVGKVGFFGEAPIPYGVVHERDTILVGENLWHSAISQEFSADIVEGGYIYYQYGFRLKEQTFRVQGRLRAN